jgi:hypothetical protein
LNKLFLLCWCNVSVICKWRSTLLDIPGIQFALPPTESFTQHLQSIMLYLFSTFSGQNKSFAQQLPHRFFPPLRNQGPTGDRWIQNHLCSDNSTDSIPKLCYNLQRIYGLLSCRANCIDSPLPFGVLVSSSLTPFPCVLTVRGCTRRIRTQAFIVFLYGARGSASALNPSYRSRPTQIIHVIQVITRIGCFVVINRVFIT